MENCVAAEVLGAAGPGVPRDVALNRGSPHRREQESRGAEWPVRPSERACVRGPRAPGASRFCLLPSLILLGGIKVGN